MRIASIVVAFVVSTIPAVSQQLPPTFQFALVDRAGTVTRLGPTMPGTFSARVSPDGSRIVMDSANGLYMAPLEDVTARRPFVAPPSAYPMWSDDGRQVVFDGFTDGQEALFAKNVDDDSPPRLLVKPARAPESWSTSNGVFTFIRLTGATDYAIWTYALSANTPALLIDTPSSAEHSSQFSPDGRTLAFASNESGMWEVYLQRFPRRGDAIRVTNGGGAHPLWSRDGNSLYFDRGGKLFVLSVTTGNEIRIGQPTALPIGGFIQGGGRRQFDLMPDGRFLILLP